MDRLQFYKSLYDQEFEKLKEFQNSLNIPLAIIVVIATGIYSILTTFHYDNFNCNSIIFLVLCSISILFLIWCMYYFLRIFAFSLKEDSKYRYIEFTDNLENNYKDLRQYYMAMSPPNPQQALIDYENSLLENLALTCGANARFNIRKAALLQRGKELLSLSLVFIIGAFIPYFINFFYHIKG